MALSQTAEWPLLSVADLGELPAPDDHVRRAVRADQWQSVLAFEYRGTPIFDSGTDLLAAGWGYLRCCHAPLPDEHLYFYGWFWTPLVRLDLSPDAPDGNGFPED